MSDQRNAYPQVINGTSEMTVSKDNEEPILEPSQAPSVKSRKAEKERVRVSRACDRCKGKKIRCTGKKPCALCSRLGLPCDFNAKYTRGRLPPIEGEDSISKDSPRRQSMVFSPDDSRVYIPPDTPVDVAMSHETQRPNSRELAPMGNGVESAAQSSRNSPEPSQTDRQGHYVGPSSGVSFLLRAQKRFHKIVTLSPNSSIFTFGDTPLPDFDSSFFVLPPKEKALKLVARYFDFAVPTHRFLHEGTVREWLEELYNDEGVINGRDRKGERGKRAVLFMCFAQAEEYMPQVKGSEDSDRSARYFHAAEHQLRAETGEIRITSVQARLAQCFYLLSESRINHCWSLFGTTAHLVLALGIHRKHHRRSSPGQVDMIDLECRKRVFWCAYSLDNYLSAALGRPRTFHDDDIDQELPSLANDAEIVRNAILPNISKTQSIMLAPIYHCRLSQIISGILRDLYGIRPLRQDLRAHLAKKHHDALQMWRAGIAHFLDVDANLLNETFRRQSNVLRLAYAHARILVHRPFLLSNFNDLTREGRRSDRDTRHSTSGQHDRMSTEESVQECLKAAMSIIDIVNELNENGQCFRAFWFTHYYAFCAVVVLYIHTIQRRSSPRSSYMPYFNAAARCQEQISLSGRQKDSFAQRYSIVLEELRLEALKQIDDAARNAEREAQINGGRDHHETEVAHTILRLSENNNQPQTPQTNGFGLPIQANNNSFQPINVNAISSPSPHQHQNQQLPPNQQQHRASFPSYDSAAPNFGVGGAFGFTAGPGSGTSPGSLMGDATGWGEFDSFVTAGIGGFGMGDSMAFDGLDGMNTGEAWSFGLGAIGTTM